MNDVERINQWLNTTALGRTTRGLFYALLASALGYLITAFQAQPDLVGAMTPLFVPVLIWLKNVLDPQVPNFRLPAPPAPPPAS